MSENRPSPFKEGLTVRDYERLAMRTANFNGTEKEMLIEVGLGITGEAGEVADMIKKHVRQGHALDKEHLAKELGDVAWYLALGCRVLNVPMEVVLQANIDKLAARYPNGFETAKSVNRAEGDV